MSEPIYLDTYILQQDMRIRLPKSIINNMNVTKGVTHFSIYLDADSSSLILRKEDRQKEDGENEGQTPDSR